MIILSLWKSKYTQTYIHCTAIGPMLLLSNATFVQKVASFVPTSTSPKASDFCSETELYCLNPMHAWTWFFP